MFFEKVPYLVNWGALFDVTEKCFDCRLHFFFKYLFLVFEKVMVVALNFAIPIKFFFLYVAKALILIRMPFQ